MLKWQNDVYFIFVKHRISYEFWPEKNPLKKIQKFLEIQKKISEKSLKKNTVELTRRIERMSLLFSS